jgi:hypothetical protein
VAAVFLVLRAEGRRRWRAWTALALLVALVGGTVLAAMAAGRRTEDAFPSFLAAHGFDAVVYAGAPWPRRVKLAEVTSVSELIGPDTGQPTCACSHPINPTDFGVIFTLPTSRPVFKLVSGRLPDPRDPDQVLASFTLQKDDGVHLGTVVTVPFYAATQAAAFNDATGAPPAPTGPVVAFHVVGFAATEFEFPSGTTPSYDLYATPAFVRTVLARTAFGYVYAVRLRHGAADLAQFDDQVRALGADVSNEDVVTSSVEASIHPQAIGWWALAALAALVGLVVLGQALGRQSNLESEGYRALSALGADRAQLAALGLARSFIVGLAGAMGALVVALVLSPVAPLGEARVAETYTGVRFDPLVLPVGAPGLVVLVLALGAWPAVRAARSLPTGDQGPTPRPSLVSGRLAALGAPPSALIGVRNAFERGGQQTNVPVGSALLGTVLAVSALCATAVFGASLAHLTASPSLYGDTFQLNFSDPNGAGPDQALLNRLRHDPAVSGVTEGLAVEVSLDKRVVGAIAFAPVRGEALLATVDGHVPRGGDQIGLGTVTMRQAGVHLGGFVHVSVPTPSGGARTVAFRVVSQISFPVLGGVVSLGTGAALTMSAYQEAACPLGPSQPACLRSLLSGPINGGLLVSVVPGRPGQAAVNRYSDAYRSITALPIVPTSLVNFGEAVNFPLIFGGLLALSGAATLVHLLAVNVSRRRREMGLLKALGFVNSQVVATVVWQATALAAVGTVVGVPLGVALGRQVWDAFANNLGAVPVAVVRFWLLAAIVTGCLVVANLLAVAPALAARRTRPEQLLRAQ